MSDSDSTDEIMAQAQVMIARLRALLQTADEVRRLHDRPAHSTLPPPPDASAPAGSSTEES